MPLGTRSRHEGGQAFCVERDGRDVSLVVAQRGVYGYRLAEDLVEFLGRKRGQPVVEEYTIPRSLMMAAYSPLLIALLGMGGGAIGGGIGGGVGGGLLMANLAIVRKESWSVAARIWGCIAVTLGGTIVFGGLVIAIVLMLRGANNPPANPPQFGPVATNPPVAERPEPQMPPMRPFPQVQPMPPFQQPPTPPPFQQPPAIPPDQFVPLPSNDRTPAAPAAVTGPKTPPPASGMEGLIGYWPLDEGSGPDAIDASGRGHEGMLTRARWVEGIRGGAVRFEGDGFLDYGDSPDFNFARGESFSITGWFQSLEWAGPLVSHRLAKDGAPVIDIALEDRTVTATVREDGNETPFVAKLAGRPIQDDAWHHFAVVRHGSDSVELYLDGELHKQVAGMNTGGPITTNLRAIGSERYWVKTSWPAPHYLKGAIDEVCVFNRDLKPEEIRSLAGR